MLIRALNLSSLQTCSTKYFLPQLDPGDRLCVRVTKVHRNCQITLKSFSHRSLRISTFINIC